MRTAIGSPRTGAIGWAQRHPTVVDSAFAVALFVVSVAAVQQPDLYAEHSQGLDPLGYVLMAGTTLPLAVRRRWPITVLAVTTACLLPFLVLGYREGIGTFGPLMALYTVGAHVPRPRSLWATGAAITGFAAVCFAGVAWAPEEMTMAVAIGNIAMVIAVVAVGDALRSRRAYVAELQRRVETGEQLRQEEAALAVAAERARIARELHDVVAHGMSVMVVQAGAARRVVDRDPAAATEALGQIERTGRESMAEMRQLLGVLRDEAGAVGGAPVGSLAPQPDLADLPALVAAWRGAGLDLTCTTDGDLAGVPPGVGLSAYRIVQEALTNAVRHAGPARVEVRVVRGGDALHVSVVDDGRGAATDPDRSDGHGVVGMRERAAVHGGRLTAGPRPDGGWRVHAAIPVAPADAATGAPPGTPAPPAPRTSGAAPPGTPRTVTGTGAAP